ncbi:methyl-accepting chemotaxis protein [Cerasicoccus fimbriatus]|uniref:methyl-accepting chemotaxis protein n=1 Tax=Cerasicoccus fimbriatus TaxID=3014554 RepID=UPI0022B5ABE3|nr:methyl-accepting chemotaxis protein [Cerasicoccus sp. TK19100]
MSLRTKILVYVLLPVILTAGSVAVYNIYRGHTRMLEKDQELMSDDLIKIALRIEQDNLEAVTVSRTIADAQESGMFGLRKESVSLLRRILEANPEFVGVSIGYEPNADGQDAEFLASFDSPPDWVSEDGRFIPYIFRDLTDGGRIKSEVLVDMESSLYYRGVRQALSQDSDLRYLVTEPYIYNDLNLIVEQMSPIVINGRFQGVTGVDRALDTLSDTLQGLKPYPRAQLYLISSRGRIIATTLGDEYRTMPIDRFYVQRNDGGPGRVMLDLFEKSPDGKLEFNPERGVRLQDDGVDQVYRTLFDRISQTRQNSPPMLFEDPLSGEESYLASAYIPTGGWRIAMTVPESVITGPTWGDIERAIIVGLIGIMTVLLIIVIFANRFSARIKHANDLAQAVADGNLTHEVEIVTNDETGQLLKAIELMVENLNNLLLQVKNSTIQLVSTATRISGASKSQEVAIQDFGASTQQIASAVNQISATSRELLDTMRDVASSANETGSIAEDGRRQLMDMSASMDNLSSATSSIAAKLAVISEKANNITKVVTTIGKVSEQTNLLSLNAAIEAEKAGEHGQGFSVVAREIRRLAHQTANATVNIDSMVNEMQAAVSSGVMEMDKFNESVRNGVTEVGELGERLDEIITGVQTVTPRFASVSEGMEAQTQGAQQISEAMTTLRDGAARTAESLKEFDEATRALHAAVNGLRREVSRFKVKDKASTGMTNMPFPMRAGGQPQPAPEKRAPQPEIKIPAKKKLPTNAPFPTRAPFPPRKDDKK